MAKLKRSDLKSLVKECLVEILAEGISSEALLESKQTKKRKIKTSPEREFLSRKKSLDNISFESATKNASKNLTDDPIMQAIFSDTAKTTLQEQLSANNKPAVTGGDRASQIMSQVNPEDIFEGTSNWASLAFADKVTPTK